MKLIILSCIWILVDWAGQEILSMLAISLGKTSYTIFIVLENLYFISYYWGIGFEVCIVIIIAELIGEQQLKHIKKWCYTLTCMIFCCAVSIGLFYLIFRRQILTLYIKNDKLVDIAMPLLPIVSFNVCLHVIVAIQSAICSGLGHYFFPTIISTICGLGVTVGLAILFAIKLEKGVIGILYAITIGGLIQIILLLVYLSFLNLERVIEEAYERMEYDKTQDKIMDEDDEDCEFEKLKEKVY